MDSQPTRPLNSRQMFISRTMNSGATFTDAAKAWDHLTPAQKEEWKYQAVVMNDLGKRPKNCDY